MSMSYQTQNPYDLSFLKEYHHHSDSEVEGVLALSSESYRGWQQVSLTARAQQVATLAQSLRRHKEVLAKLAALEMGKPLAQGRSEVEKCAVTCDFLAAKAEEMLASQVVPAHYTKTSIIYRPLGPVLLIMPWNFPYWQVVRAAAPALLAGNTVILKHADMVSGCAEEIEKVFMEAFDQNEFINLRADHEQCKTIIASPKIAGVSFTGSTRGGKAIAALAGASLKKYVLELGGSDPYVVLKDADLEKAAEICVNTRLTNAGQSCVAAKRFIIEESVIQEFTKLFVDRMKNKKTGDPLQEGIDVGPLAAPRFLQDITRQVGASVVEGAKLELGGEPMGQGCLFQPTVLTGVEAHHTAFREEIFGPVASIIKARDEAHAIKLANQTNYGLGAAIFTQDLKKGERIASDELEAGFVTVNDSVKSDVRVPFGGIKESGIGRELGSHGLHEFCNVKTVGVQS